ncbi:MAG TPA: hypothetical protein VFS58_01640 [Steroidobacteraceae bacterium]|nr:hypothetical protein [Steroidobacteraceae bacterium]
MVEVLKLEARILVGSVHMSGTLHPAVETRDLADVAWQSAIDGLGDPRTRAVAGRLDRALQILDFNAERLHKLAVRMEMDGEQPDLAGLTAGHGLIELLDVYVPGDFPMQAAGLTFITQDELPAPTLVPEEGETKFESAALPGSELDPPPVRLHPQPRARIPSPRSRPQCWLKCKR